MAPSDPDSPVVPSETVSDGETTTTMMILSTVLIILVILVILIAIGLHIHFKQKRKLYQVILQHAEIKIQIALSKIDAEGNEQDELDKRVQLRIDHFHHKQKVKGYKAKMLKEMGSGRNEGLSTLRSGNNVEDAWMQMLSKDQLVMAEDFRDKNISKATWEINHTIPDFKEATKDALQTYQERGSPEKMTDRHFDQLHIQVKNFDTEDRSVQAIQEQLYGTGELPFMKNDEPSIASVLSKLEAVDNFEQETVKPDAHPVGGHALARQKTLVRNGHVDRYVDRFWKYQIEMQPDDIILNTKEIDTKVHSLIHQLLLAGEDDPSMRKQAHYKKHMIKHQERIIAVKDAIKPGIIYVYTKPFTKEMLKEYFAGVLIKNLEPDIEEIKERAEKQMKSDIELNIKSPNYYAQAFQNKVQHDQRIQQLQNIKQGPRQIKMTKVVNISTSSPIDKKRVNYRNQIQHFNTKMSSDMMDESIQLPIPESKVGFYDSNLDCKSQLSPKSMRSGRVYSSWNDFTTKPRSPRKIQKRKSASALTLKFDSEGNAIGIHHEDKFSQYIEDSFYHNKISQNAIYKNKPSYQYDNDPVIGTRRIENKIIGKRQNSLQFIL